MKDDVFALHSRLERRHWWFRGRRAITIAIIDQIASVDPSVIVDVGCGTGGTVDALSKRYRCIGIDSSELAITTARALYPDAEFRCGVVPDDIQDLQPETGLYLIMDVLEHIEKDREFLERLVSFARPGSRFLITVPARQALWSQHDVTAGHFRRYEPADFRALWNDLPIHESLFSFMNRRLYPVIRAVRYLSRKMGRASGNAGTDFSLPHPAVNELLTRIFAGERKAVMSRWGRVGSSLGWPGVSLIAVLEKSISKPAVARTE
jgi:SAM-dependent methyltransferase